MSPTPSALDRRRFLKLGLSAGAAIGCGAPVGERRPDSAPGEMRYRPLGKTGLRVSEISFGAHGVDNPSLMRAAVDAGINTFCTSGPYMDGMEEASLGQAISTLGGRRDELVLATGGHVRREATRRSILDSIDDSLRRLKTDHVELFYSAEVRTPEDLRVEALFEAFEEARQAGKVLHLGLSGHHGGMQACLEAATEDGRFEMFFTKYDFVSYPDQDAILHRAAAQGVGTIVFKTNAGSRQQEIEDLETGGLSFEQATIKWALTNPDLSSVCKRITSFSQIRDYSAAVSDPLKPAEVAMLRRYADAMYDKYCRFCATCETSCPRGVAVAEVMRHAMYFKYYHREKLAMSLYASLPPERRAGSCEQCRGPCEGACPFGRRIRDELREAHTLLRFA